MAKESSTEKVVLDVVVFTVLWDADEVVGDQISSSRDRFLLWRLIFEIRMSMTYCTDIIIKSPKYLLTWLVQIMEKSDTVG